MKFSTVATGLAACLVPVAAVVPPPRNPPPAFRPITATSDDPLVVPGESPLEFCEADRSADILDIREVNLSPNPPQRGTELLIRAVGEVKQTIEEGAYVKLEVKYGLIKLLSTTADLCEQVKNVNLECPIKPGNLVLGKTVELPGEIPPGTYNVKADVYTADDEKITCLTASVSFGRTGNLFDFEL